MSMMNRFALLAIVAILAAVVAGCASTQIVSSWKDESFGRTTLAKTLVVFQNRDPALRRTLEDEMARDIPGSTPAYRVFNDDEVQDLDRVKARVREMGFDSAVVMRVVSVDREISYMPPMRPYLVPSMHRHFWGYWGYGWRAVYDPMYLRNDRILTIATNVYDVRQDKLVWASQSETFNPMTLRGAIAEVVKVTSKATGEALRASRG